MNHGQVTVILLNWKRPKNLPGIIASLRRQTVKPTIWLWNNGEDGQFDVDRYHRSEKNEGCFARWRMALEADTEFVCIIDDDMEILDDKLLATCMDEIREQKNNGRIIGITGMSFNESLGYQIENSRVISKDKDVLVDIVKGQFMFMSRSSINGFRSDWSTMPRGDDICISSCVSGRRFGRHLLPASIHGMIREMKPDENGMCREKQHLAMREVAVKLHFGRWPRITNRITLINWLIMKMRYTSYLEIGINTGRNFDAVVCFVKHGVDPNPKCTVSHRMTSDEFFASNKNKYDLIFIDGLHLEEQVLRDIDNSLMVLNPGGTIVVHDCNPKTEESQLEKRLGKEWHGTVWKGWVRALCSRNDIFGFVVDIDCGCGIIRMGRRREFALPDKLDFEFLRRNRKNVLNLVDVDEAKRLICSTKQANPCQNDT